MFYYIVGSKIIKTNRGTINAFSKFSPVLLSGKEVILAYELLNALQVLETKWGKQVLYFNADILIGKKLKDSEYLAVIQYLNTSWCFPGEFPGDL